VLFNEDDCDEQGKDVDLAQDVILTHGQQLTLSRRTKTGLREVVLWFDAPEDHEEPVPVEAPPPSDRLPVLT
jgi:hypothetical protein